MSHTEAITYEEHCNFVKNLISDDSKWYVAVFEDSLLLATLNYTKDEKGEWERGIISSPLIRGRHLTGQIEEMFYPILRKRNIRSLSAKVRKDNTASRHYHERIGYKQISNDSSYCYYKLFI